MDHALEQAVHQRANHLCEYCRLPEALSDLGHVIDHIKARQHGGETVTENLALCCGRCNLHKGPNLTGVDPASGRVVRLFNPREHTWHQHFRWDGSKLLGLTPIGQATISVLAINDPIRLASRSILIATGKLRL